LQFSPFHNNILASGGADATVKIWRFPEEGLVARESTDYKANLQGHYKKIIHLKWHPASEFTMATASDDGKCKVWDVQRSSAVCDITTGLHPYSFEWNYDGSCISLIGKDGKF
jgi:WD40 repeat protein